MLIKLLYLEVEQLPHYIDKIMIGCVAQLGERRPYKANVGSSNLSTPTISLIIPYLFPT